ncbi:MAG: hypothetical protein EA425_15765 [Puniceicoccaceae bacterium]|nr:MAG: hypothetical protein EA425_15765 [Puniceicoccaceae bacterium]
MNDTPPMRIGTYNVLGLQGYPPEAAEPALGEPGSEARIAHFTKVFSQLDCDVLALQEGVANLAVIKQVAQRMNVWLATFPSPQNWPGHILSRCPILESRVFSHQTPDETTPPLSRCAGAVLLETAPEQRLWVVGLHLHPRETSAALREREAEVLLPKIDGLMEEVPNAVVMGDFNGNVEERIHRELSDRGFVNVVASQGELQPTMDTAGKTLCVIDHIYLSPSLAAHLESARVVRDPGFRVDGPQREGLWAHADHLPVLAELTGTIPLFGGPRE